MQNIDQLTQILFEISMTIGAHLDLNRMLRDVSLVTLRKLNGTAFVVFEQREGADGYCFDRVFMTPRLFEKSNGYAALEAVLPTSVDLPGLEQFYGALPMAVTLADGGCFHLMALPEYGLLAVYRAHGFLPPDTVSSLVRLNKKLAVACQACLSHEKLDASEKRMSLLLDTMTEGMGIIDVGGALTYVNNGMASMFGYESPAALIGTPLADLFDDENKLILKEHLQLRGQGDISAYEITFRKKDKSSLPALISPQILRDKEGNYAGSFAIITDLTSQKRAEEQIVQGRKMEAISVLAGGIAHDFNNLLSVIAGNVSHALEDFNVGAELSEVLSDVQEGARQAQHLTRQLLTFAKGGDPIKQPGNINRLLEAAATFMTSGSKSKCEFKLSDDLWNTEMDEGQIDQVINNLIMNADQAMQEGGIIEVRTENVELEALNELALPAGRYIKLSVEDQGMGIPEDHLSRIFDPYFTTKQTGSGLGLATVYSIIKKHGGDIGVRSVAREGTVFHVYLPAYSKTVVRADQEENKAQQAGSGRILVMDDQEQILKMAARILARIGYEPESATDGAQAVELYREAYEAGTPYDLVILDLTVPGGMGGERALRELLKIDPEVKALVSSGYSGDPIMANYRDYGFCGIIAKPYTKNEMAAALHEVLHPAE